LEELGLAKLVLFDLDGTLIDSARQIMLAVDHSREDLKYTHGERDFLKSKIGLSAYELFADLKLSESEIEKAVELFREYLWAIKLEPNDVFNDVQKLLELLRNKGLKLAVATNKPTDLAKHALESVSLLNFFDLVVGSENLAPKPNPAILISCLATLKIKPPQVVMIGDRCEDMSAARAAKVLGYGVLQGVHTEEQLKVSGASKVFRDISQLLRQVKGMS
jgi:phosphoglycolate phosphatase